MPPAKDPQALLTLAVVQVMQQVEKVGLGGRNTQQGYDFTTDPDMVLALRGAMAEYGLTLRCVKIEPFGPALDVAYQTRSGSNMWRTTGLFTWELTHVGGGSEQFVTLGCGTDTSDKHTNCAMTVAKKYALEQRFLVARTNQDDIERDTPDRDQPPQWPPQQRQSQAQAQRPAPQQPPQGQQRPPQGRPIFCPECRTEMWANLDPPQRPDGSVGKRNFRCRNKGQCGVTFWETDLQGQPLTAFLDLLREYQGEVTGSVQPAEDGYDERNPPPPDY